MKKPNILWIMTDQQSAAMMSCTGNWDLHTPNLDYLARHGIRFENAYCTNPVCLPSRFSLITGLYPGDIDLSSNEYHQEVKGLPEAVFQNALGIQLKEAGYEAVYGGKEHFPGMTACELGFDKISDDEREQLAETCSEYLLNYKRETPFAMVASFINPHDICLMAINDFAQMSDTGEERWLVEHFKDAVETVNKAADIPDGMHRDVFFECVCPELPLNYQPSDDEPEAIKIMQHQRRFMELAREHYTDEQWRRHRYAYARLTEMADRQIGKILKALKDSGKWEDTVIIFTSDHGDMDASHKMEHKTALYQECCRIPMIIKGINTPRASINRDLISNGMDIISTILDYAQIEAPKYLRGISLKGLAEGGDTVSKRAAVIVESEFGIMAVDERYKYVRYNCGNRREQFFDLEVNPGEMYNQIEDQNYGLTVEALKKCVDEHLNRQEFKASLYENGMRPIDI